MGYLCRNGRAPRGTGTVNVKDSCGETLDGPWARTSYCLVCSCSLFVVISPLPGVPIRFGKFSAKENKQLEKNVEEFLALTGIENADKLLYTDRYPDEKQRITNLKRKYAFRVHIGKLGNIPFLTIHDPPPAVDEISIGGQCWHKPWHRHVYRACPLPPHSAVISGFGDG